MYEAGSRIVYGSRGVCTVVEVGPLAGAERDRLYYKLKPAGGGSETIYAPVDAPVFMRPVISRQEAEALIARMPDIAGEVCASHSAALLRQQYDALFAGHSCDDWVRLVKGVYRKAQRGKGLGSTDQRYRKRAEEVLHGELAAALDIPVEAVPGYIHAVLEPAEEQAPEARENRSISS